MQSSQKNKAQPESPFFSLLADAESIQVREVSKSTQPAIVRSVDEAVQSFDKAEKIDVNSETRSFLVTVKKPTATKKVSASAAPEFQRDHNSILRQASLLMNSGDYLLARNLYSYVLKGNIRDAEALKGLGICLLHLVDTLSAKKCFNALIELYASPEGAALLGICYAHEQNDKAAQEQFLKVNDPNRLPVPLRFDYFKEYGNCLTRLGRLNEASVSYRCALEINPNSDIVYVNLGTLEMQRHQFETAANNFQRAIELSPKNSKAYCGIGILAQIGGEKTVAETYFEKSLDFDPQNSVALLQLIALAKQHTDWQRIKLRLVKLLLKEPNNLDMRFLLATALFKENDWTDCERELEFILQKNPNHEKAQRLRNELSLQKHV